VYHLGLCVCVSVNIMLLVVFFWHYICAYYPVDISAAEIFAVWVYSILNS